MSPEAARQRLFGDEPTARRRLTELGKALRRSGLLLSATWTLSPSGEIRSQVLRGEMVGGSPANGERKQ